MNTENKTVLHHYLGIDLKMFSEESGRIITLDGLHYLEDRSVNFITNENVHNSSAWDFKPLLHSMDRLKQPLENGDIPILALAKIAFPDWDFELNKDGAISRDGSYRIFFYFCRTYFSAFCETGTPIDAPNQLQCFQYLIKHHFNCFSLPEGEYIEKSTLKL